MMNVRDHGFSTSMLVPLAGQVPWQPPWPSCCQDSAQSDGSRCLQGMKGTDHENIGKPTANGGFNGNIFGKYGKAWWVHHEEDDAACDKCAFDKVSMRIHLISKFHDVWWCLPPAMMGTSECQDARFSYFTKLVAVGTWLVRVFKMFEYVRIMFPRIGCSGNFCMLYINIPVFYLIYFISWFPAKNTKHPNHCLFGRWPTSICSSQLPAIKQLSPLMGIGFLSDKSHAILQCKPWTCGTPMKDVGIHYAPLTVLWILMLVNLQLTEAGNILEDVKQQGVWAPQWSRLPLYSLPDYWTFGSLRRMRGIRSVTVLFSRQKGMQTKD